MMRRKSPESTDELLMKSSYVMHLHFTIHRYKYIHKLCIIPLSAILNKVIVSGDGGRLYSHFNLDIIFGANTRTPSLDAIEQAMDIQKNIPLKDFTTFKIGGNARFFCHVTSEDELIEAIGFSKKEKIPFFVLGGGSNILVSDKGFSGIAIKMEMKGVSYLEDGVSTLVTAYAGENWDSLVSETVEKGLYGIENLSAIPGTVGGSIVQNIGAYGVEVRDLVESVYVLDVKDDEYKTFTRAECKFGYRDSIFKNDKDRYVIISATYRLSQKENIHSEYKDIKNYFFHNRNKKITLKNIREAVVEIRKAKFPDLTVHGTAGSFFKNPIVTTDKARTLLEMYPEMVTYPINQKHVKIPLAWILDNVCHVKGLRKGNAGPYKNQALVVVNYGGSQATDVIALAQDMVDMVYEKTGIEIEPEVEYIA